MAKAYWISTYRSVKNPDALAAYGKLASPAITAAGGKFLARGIPAFAKEGGLLERTVLIASLKLRRLMQAMATKRPSKR